MIPSTSGRVREALRTATRDAHAGLDAHPLMADLMRGVAGRERYAKLLKHYACLYAELEAALDRDLDKLPNAFAWQDRRKLPWLASDLRFFGIDMPEASAVGDPIASKAAAIGVLYPLEGATLGGQAISKRLRRTLDIDETRGGRFFAGYGPQTRARWDATCLALEEIADDDAAIACAARQAVTVFARFAEALDRAAAD